MRNARRACTGRHRGAPSSICDWSRRCAWRAITTTRRKGKLEVLKTIAPSVLAVGNGRGKGVLLIDDLTDTGKTARVVREMLPEAHFATVYAKPAGTPMCHTFVTEVSQDTWIYFPWDLDLRYVEPIREGASPPRSNDK